KPEPPEVLEDLVVTAGHQPLVIAALGLGELCWWPLQERKPRPEWTHLRVGARSLALHRTGGEEHLLYLDRNDDVRSLLVADLRHEGRARSSLLFQTGSPALKCLAVDSTTAQIVLGGTNRALEVRDLSGRLRTRIQLESWVNDIVISGKAVIVLTNQ